MREIKFYNTLTNSVETFHPIKEGEVSMYVCGPTVYNDPHIGNMRPVVFFDTFKRFLEYIGYDVKYVSNLTDVDDKIINKALEEGKTEKEITSFYIDEYFKCLKDLNVEKAYANPKVTDYMDSIIKYIYRNTPTNQDSPLYKMMIFVENMLWYRGLSDGNAYCGFSNGGTLLVEGLYSSGKKEEFKKFLADNDLHYELEWRTNNGLHELMAKFPTGKKAPFVSIASTGTMSLFLYFFWSITAFNKISFLFIDEFDAFFHYESAENIVLRLNANKNFQTLLTSHNTYLMQNKLTRPDCCYIMTQNKITSLFNSTKKEIREAHNLEKMYINGAFNE